MKTDSMGRNKLMHYAMNGDLQGVKNIVSDNCVDINTADNFGYTALIFALFNENYDIAKYLIKNDATLCRSVHLSGESIFETINDIDVLKLLLEHYTSIITNCITQLTEKKN